MDTVLRKRNVDTEFSLVAVDRETCAGQLKRFFNLICKESPDDIEVNWNSVADELGDKRISIENYEKEVVPNVAILLDQFSDWECRVETDNRFLVQAMVNKIALPVWMIAGICRGNLRIENQSILNRYSEIMVDFECVFSERLGEACYNLRLETYTDHKPEPMNWPKLIKDILLYSGDSIMSYPDSILEKARNQLNQGDIIRINKIFMKLMKQSDCKSKVARIFWASVDELLLPNSKDHSLTRLPKISEYCTYC